MSENLTNPVAWAEAIAAVPVEARLAASVLLGLFLIALIVKWWPRGRRDA